MMSSHDLQTILYLFPPPQPVSDQTDKMLQFLTFRYQNGACSNAYTKGIKRCLKDNTYASTKVDQGVHKYINKQRKWHILFKFRTIYIYDN